MIQVASSRCETQEGRVSVEIRGGWENLEIYWSLFAREQGLSGKALEKASRGPLS